MDFVAARKVMVDSQVRVNDVTNRELHAAMGSVERERFCAPDRAFSAYADLMPEIAAGRFLMLPRDLGKLLEGANLKAGEKALAIAAPYAAAVLAEMGLVVTAQDSSEEVFAVTGAALADYGVNTVVAPLNQPQGEGYDVIVCEGAVPALPDSWLAALAVGGRLVVVERTGPIGNAVVYVKGAESVSRRKMFEAAPEVLTELAPAAAFTL